MNDCCVENCASCGYAFLVEEMAFVEASCHSQPILTKTRYCSLYPNSWICERCFNALSS